MEGERHKATEYQAVARGPDRPGAGGQKEGNQLDGTGIVLEDVHFSYLAGTHAERPVLRGVSLALRPGEILCLMGRTGAGKSTLLQLMAGLFRPSSGKVLWDGMPPEKSPARVGLLLQNPEQQLFAETVEKDVGFGPRMIGLSGKELRRRVEEALVLTGLDPSLHGKRSPFALSGGEMRRAALAGVLAMDPAYLLLDEPFSGLDGPSRENLIEIFHGLREKGKGLAVVTHEWEDVESLADKVAVLAEGRLKLHGSPESVASQADELSRAGIHPPDLFRLAMHLGLEKSLVSPFASPSEMADLLDGFLSGGYEPVDADPRGDAEPGARNPEDGDAGEGHGDGIARGPHGFKAGGSDER